MITNYQPSNRHVSIRQSAANNVAVAQHKLRRVFKDTVHFGASRFGDQKLTDWADNEAKGFLKRQYQNDQLIHSQPKKRQKTETPTKMAYRRKSRGGARSRRVMKRSRRRTSRRPARSRNVKGLKRLIKRIARDSAEPKRHLWGTTGGLTGTQIPIGLLNIRMDDVPPYDAAITDAHEAYRGNEYFCKGIRVRGYAFNPSQHPVKVVITFFKSTSILAPAAYDAVLAGALPLYYNPNTGISSTYESIDKIFRYNPKLGLGQPFKIVKKVVLDLDSTRTEPLETPDPLTETPMNPDGGMDDQKHFDVYIPVNRVMKNEAYELTTTAEDTRITYWASIHFTTLSLQEVVLVAPHIYLKGITYFKDA